MSEPHSKYFSLSEWEQNVGKPGWEVAEAYPVDWYDTRWWPLANMLDRIRDAWGSAIYVTKNGGFRAPRHNAKVEGKSRSQHMDGRAADIKPGSGSAAKLHDFILQMHKDGKLPELGGLGFYGKKFVHVDIRPKVSSKRLARWGEEEDRDQIA